MTTQPELPEVFAPPAPMVRLAAVSDAGDVDFDAFVRRYETRLRRLVARRIGDQGEAEEITQETLLRAYQHRSSFANEDELMAWSTVVAQRLVIDRVRVRGRSVAVAEVPENARLGRDTAEIVVARHEARAALEALEALPTRQAAILWAREVEGLHYDDIADRFGITEPAVRSLLHRGRRALRKEFEARTGSVPLNGLVPFAPWLLALKAAGKARSAAKSMVSPFTAATLGIVAITAMTLPSGQPAISPPFAGNRPGTVSSVPVESSRDMVGEARHKALYGGTPVRIGGSGGTGGVDDRSGPRLGPPQCVGGMACAGITSPDEVPTIWIELVETPLGNQPWTAIQVEPLESCPDMPDVPRVTCTESPDERPARSGDDLVPVSPTAPMGGPQ